MNRDLKDWTTASMPPTYNDVVRAIMLAVWPASEILSITNQSRKYGDIKDVLAGHPTPTVSRADRERILELGPTIADAITCGATSQPDPIFLKPQGVT